MRPKTKKSGARDGREGQTKTTRHFGWADVDVVGWTATDVFFFFAFLADSMAGKSSGQKQSNLVLAGLYWRCDQWPAPEEDPLLTPACFSILALELLPWNAIDQRLLAWPFLPPRKRNRIDFNSFGQGEWHKRLRSIIDYVLDGHPIDRP